MNPVKQELLDNIWRGADPTVALSKNLFALDLQGWNSQHRYLTEGIAAINPKVIVEIGVWKGRSTIFMASELKRRGATSAVIAVDTWLGSSEHWIEDDYFSEMDFWSGYPALYYKFISNIKRMDVADYVVPLPLDSLNAAHLLEQRHICPDMIHLDGGHHYDSVMADLRAWWPILSPGGLFIGDDYYTNGLWITVRQAFDDFFASFGLGVIENSEGKCRIRKPGTAMERRSLSKPYEPMNCQLFCSTGNSGPTQAENPSLPTAAAAIQPDVAELLAAGLEHHQAGGLPEAEAIYRRILDMMPDHADALHLLGGLAYQTGRYEAAIELIGHAIQYNGSEPSYHCTYGLVLQSLNRVREAVTSYDRALLLKPDYAIALVNRGLALETLECFAEALESYDRALAIEPDFAVAWLDRGNTLQQLARFDEALESYDRALALRPDLAETHYNRGDALLRLKRLDEAVASYDCALALKPDFAKARLDRANALYQLGRLRDKRRALSLIAKSGFVPDIVIDIGVATGTDGLYEVWPSVETILVEPLAKFEPDLIRICRSLPKASYKVAAAGATAGTLHLASNPDEPYTIRPAEDAPESWPRFQVPQVTANSLIAGKAIRRAVLKIDVDGPELNVLCGADAVLAVDAVVVIEAPLLDTATGRLGQIIRFMTDSGYECFDIIEPLFHPADDVLWQVDLVFVRRESDLRALRSYSRAAAEAGSMPTANPPDSAEAWLNRV